MSNDEGYSSQELQNGESRVFEDRDYDILATNHGEQGISSIVLFSDEGDLSFQRKLANTALEREISSGAVSVDLKSDEGHRIGVSGISGIYSQNSLTIIANGVSNKDFKKYILGKVKGAGLIEQEVIDAFPN